MFDQAEAADLQWINNRWYIYFSADPFPGQGQRRTGVLEAGSMGGVGEGQGEQGRRRGGWLLG
jgi:hypothetical protein